MTYSFGKPIPRTTATAAAGALGRATATRRPGSTLRALVELAGVAFRADRRAALTVAALVPIESAAGPLQAVGLRALTDAAGGADLRGAGLWALALALVTGAARVAATASFAARMRLGERAGMALHRRLGQLTASIPTVEHFERADYQREVDLVSRDSGWLSDVFSAVVHHASALGRLALTAGLLAALHPLLGLLPLFGVPSLFAGARAQRIQLRVGDAVAELRRAERHFVELATTEAPGKEVRIFGLGDELVARHARVRAAVDRIEDAGGLEATLATSLGWLAFAAGFVGAVAFVVGRAAAGEATPGDVVLVLALAGQVNGQVAGLAGGVSWATHGLDVAGRYRWLTEYADRASRPPDDPAGVPERLERGITLEDVTFVYPGTEKVALAGVSLHLPAGSTVAIVGENGAGKTTLIKLLCRLYEPTRGRVAVDGVDLRRLDPAAWRARTAAGFQDFARFLLLARETVGVGDVRRVDDDTAVAAALERAHAGDVAAQLPEGLATRLGRAFKRGTTLSEGQWQKLALGRAMMRPTPLLLVLDEPTAALDAPAEHALFERYAGAARRAAAANGGVTVLVSHRFSTVRMADLIAVLQGGRLVDCGTHADLMTRSGLYAELYGLQAAAYR